MSAVGRSDAIAAAVTPGTIVSSVRHYQVALSTEALALGWLRQEDAPHGAMVVADSEIAARTRSDDVITNASVAMSMVVRTSIPADHQDILWAVALLAGSAAMSEGSDDVVAWWPEEIRLAGDRIGNVAVATQLSGGSTVSSVMTFRLGSGAFADPDSSHRMLRRTAVVLGEMLALTPAGLAESYRAICGLLGRKVRVELRPRGASGGVAASIDERGAFGVAATSGSLTRLGIDQIKQIVDLT